MKVLITGAAGQLGTVMVQRFRDDGHEVTGATRADLDITQHTDVMRAAVSVRPQLIINCAAYNNVDGAETQQQTALEVNAFAVGHLARAARDYDATLVHYSTDFVFSGTADTPYRESDRPSPESVYASSKYLGERMAADAARHYVLRVESLFGGPNAHGSVDRIVSQLVSGKETRVFVDRVVSPSYVEDVVEATVRLLSTEAPFGLYHCVNSGYATWFALGSEVARLVGADERLLVQTRVADVTMAAKRPKFAALANDKITAAGAFMPPWQDAIARHVATSRRRAER